MSERTGDEPAALRVALEAYARAAIAELRAMSPGDFLRWDSERWSSDDGTTYRRVIESSMVPHPRTDERLHALDTYAAAREAIRRDPDLGRMIGQLVGTADAGRPLLEEDMVLDRIPKMLFRLSGRRFNRAAFMRAFRATIESLRQGEFPIKTIVPLLGLGVARSLSIRPGVSLDNMSDDELSKCLELGLYAQTPAFMGMMSVRSKGCLGIRQMSARVVGDEDESHSDERQRLDRERRQITEAVVAALRLHRPEEFQPAGTVVIKREPWPIAESASFSVRPIAGGHIGWSVTYEVTGRDARRLRYLFERLERNVVSQPTALATACRRFVSSFERDTPDDRLLDLMIAAEALFLDESPTELGYRLSLNAANYMSNPGADRRALRRFVSDTYQVRSKIVHGGNPAPEDVRFPDGSRGHRLVEVQQEFENLMRRSLVQAVGDGRWKGPTADWTRLALRR